MKIIHKLNISNQHCLAVDSKIKSWNMTNSLWPADGIWKHRSWSTLAQVMASCLMTPSHYLNLNVELSSKVFCGIHTEAMSQEVLMNITCDMFSTITFSEVIPYLPGANELKQQSDLPQLTSGDVLYVTLGSRAVRNSIHWATNIFRSKSRIIEVQNIKLLIV